MDDRCFAILLKSSFIFMQNNLGLIPIPATVSPLYYRPHHHHHHQFLHHSHNHHHHHHHNYYHHHHQFLHHSHNHHHHHHHHHHHSLKLQLGATKLNPSSFSSPHDQMNLWSPGPFSPIPIAPSSPVLLLPFYIFLFFPACSMRMSALECFLSLEM